MCTLDVTDLLQSSRDIHQNICLNISIRVEYGLCWIKNKVTRSNLFKNLPGLKRAEFSLVLMNFHQNVCLGDILVKLKLGSCAVKN